MSSPPGPAPEELPPSVLSRAAELSRLDAPALRALLLAAEFSLPSERAAAAFGGADAERPRKVPRASSCTPTGSLTETVDVALSDAPAPAPAPAPTAPAPAPTPAAPTPAAPAPAAPATEATAPATGRPSARVRSQSANLARADWSKLRRRRVALRVAYLGTNYAGFAVQDNAPTVEGALLEALHKTCLIPTLVPGDSNYTRCGRTDKGVSALAQVVALDIRTNYPFIKERLKAAGVPDASFPANIPKPADAVPSHLAPDMGVAASNPLYCPRIMGLLPAGSLLDPAAHSQSRSATSPGQEEADALAAAAGDKEARKRLEKGFESYLSGQTFRIAHARVRSDGVRMSDSADAGEAKADDAPLVPDELPARPDPDHDVPSSAYDWWADSFEIDYCALLNQQLPPDIRVTAWAPCSQSFSARFSCDSRTYKYLFFADGMDIAAMHKAAKLLEGAHDFRNLCYMDVANVTHFHRRVIAATVRPCQWQDSPSHSRPSPGPGPGPGTGTGTALGEYGPAPLAPTYLPGSRGAAGPGPGDAPPAPAPALSLPEGTPRQRAAPASEGVPLVGAKGSGAPVDAASEARRAREVPVVGSNGGVLRARAADQQTLEPCDGSSSSASASEAETPVLLPSETLCEFVVTGEAFLYHQVRCMIAVLFLVGRGLERPEIVTDLLDITKFPAKPVYDLGSDLPLVLWEGTFPGLRWVCSPHSALQSLHQLHRQARELKLRAAIADCFWRSLLPTARAVTLPQRPPSLAQHAVPSEVVSAAETEAARVLSGAARLPCPQYLTAAPAAAPTAQGKGKGGRGGPAGETFVSAAPQVTALRALGESAFPPLGTPLPSRAGVVPFVAMQPPLVPPPVPADLAALGAGVPSNHPDPLSFISPTFPAVSLRDYAFLRAVGATGFQTARALPPRRLPYADAAAAALVEGAGVFPYAEVFGHVPLAVRPRDKSFEERIAQLKGKKRGKHEKTNAFIAYMNSRIK